MNRILVITVLCVVLAQSLPQKRGFKVFHGDRLTAWSQNEFKFVVALVGGGLCSGSIYSTTSVISAGHCFKGKTTPVEVLFGAVHIHDENDRRIDIKNVHIRGDYSRDYDKVQVNGKDISIVRLEQSIPTAKYAVSIATVTLTIRPQVGEVITIVGYGLDSHRELKAGNFNQGQLEVIDCPRGKYEGEPICMPPKEEFHRQKNEGGDSGGPAVMRVYGQWVVVGVSSGYTEFTNGRVISVYASTAANGPYIEKFTADN